MRWYKHPHPCLPLGEIGSFKDLDIDKFKADLAAWSGVVPTVCCIGSVTTLRHVRPLVEGAGLELLPGIKAAHYMQKGEFSTLKAWSDLSIAVAKVRQDVPHRVVLLEIESAYEEEGAGNAPIDPDAITEGCRLLPRDVEYWFESGVHGHNTAMVERYAVMVNAMMRGLSRCRFPDNLWHRPGSADANVQVASMTTGGLASDHKQRVIGRVRVTGDDGATNDGATGVIKCWNGLRCPTLVYGGLRKPGLAAAVREEFGD